MPVLSMPAGILSLVLLLTSISLTVIAATMYVWWRRYKGSQKRQNVFETAENITSNIDLARQIGNLEAATFPPEKQQHNEDKLPTSPQRKRVSSPAAVVRSFSGQFNVTKVSPSMRRMNKINSQIIMFNGQPHFQVENLDRRAMHNELVKRLK